MRYKLFHLRHMHFCRLDVCRTARCCHKRRAFLHPLNKFRRLIFGRVFRPVSNLNNIIKAQRFIRGDNFAQIIAELPENSRCHHRDNFFGRILQRIQHVNHLRVIHNRAKRAGLQTLSAGNTLVYVNFFPAVRIFFNRINRTRLFTRHNRFMNSAVRAILRTQTAFNALVLLNKRLIRNRNCFLGAICFARPRHARLTHRRHLKHLAPAGIARRFNNR